MVCQPTLFNSPNTCTLSISRPAQHQQNNHCIPEKTELCYYSTAATDKFWTHQQESTQHVMRVLFDLVHRSKAASAAIPSIIRAVEQFCLGDQASVWGYVTHRAQSILMLVLICTLKMEVQPKQKSITSKVIDRKKLYIWIIVSMRRQCDNKTTYKHTGRPPANRHRPQTRPLAALCSRLHRLCATNPPHHR